MSKILIVEDETFLRQTIAAKLREKGHEVLEADNGKDGMDMALNNMPDLMLLDIVLPSVDGISVLSHLRQDDQAKNIPVIILTNLAEDDKVKEAEQMGAQAYVVKANSNLEDVIKLAEDELQSNAQQTPQPQAA